MKISNIMQKVASDAIVKHINNSTVSFDNSNKFSEDTWSSLLISALSAFDQGIESVYDLKYKSQRNLDYGLPQEKLDWDEPSIDKEHKGVELWGYGGVYEEGDVIDYLSDEHKAIEKIKEEIEPGISYKIFDVYETNITGEPEQKELISEYKYTDTGELIKIASFNPYNITGSDAIETIKSIAFEMYADKTTKNIKIGYKEIDNLLNNTAKAFLKCAFKLKARTLNDFLLDMLHMAWYKYEQDYVPRLGKQYILEDAKKTIERLWTDLQGGDESAQDSLKFYVDLYKTISATSDQQWELMHQQVWPDYHEWLTSDIREEMKEEAKPSFEDIMTQVEQYKPSAKPDVKPEPEVSLEPSSVDEEVEDINKLLQEQKKIRRPIEQFEDKIKVFVPGKSKYGKEPTVPVGIGDKIKNISLEHENIPPTGRPGRSKFNEGIIKEITDAGSFIVQTESDPDNPKEPGVQEWNPDYEDIEADAVEYKREYQFREAHII